MPVYVSYHTANSYGLNIPIYNKGGRAEVLGPAFLNESKTPAPIANNFTPAPENCFVRIANHGSNTRIAFVSNTEIANTANGNVEYWPDGTVEVRYLPLNFRISIVT